MPDPVWSEFVYVDTALGALNRRNHVQRLSDVNFKDEGAERYISHRRGTAALFKWTLSHRNDSGQPTIEGFDGEVWDPSLPFDFDDRHDPARALGWLRQFLDRLENYDVPLDALRIYFSGYKGFHLEIPHTLFGGFEPSAELHVWEKRAAVELMAGIPFDTAVYDKLRLWRLPNTLNLKGQRYKIRLDYTEVRGLSMAEVLELATAPRPRPPTAGDEEWGPNDYLVEVWARSQAGPPPDMSVEPLAWSDNRQTQLLEATVQAAIAASWPTNDATKSRHSDYLLPLSGFLARQMPADQVSRLLVAAARMAGDRSFIEDRHRHWQDEIARLAEGSAAKIAAGQPVEGLPTIGKHWPELAEFLSSVFVTRIDRGEGSRNGRESRGFVLAPTEELLAEPPESVSYLVEGLLPSGGISLWGAKPKVGKSVAVRNLARCVARGEPFLDRATHQGVVILLALEEKRSEVANHLRSMGLTNEPLHIHTGAAPATSKEGLAALANVIAVYQPVLVVVDPVLKLVRVRDSSDYAELTRELEPVIELARKTGCHIAVTHHLGKMARDGGDDVLGSTAIFGAVDTLVLFRRRKDNLRTLETIQRYGKDQEEVLIPLDAETGCISVGGSLSEMKMAEARTAVLELLATVAEGEEGFDQNTIRSQAGVQTALAYNALQALFKEGLVTRTGAGRGGSPYLYRLPPPEGYSSCSLVLDIYGEQENKRTGPPEPVRTEPAGGDFPDQAKQAKQVEQPEQEPAGPPVCAGCGEPGGVMVGQYRLHNGCSVRFSG